MHRHSGCGSRSGWQKRTTDKPFGVNVMLMSPYADEVAQVIAEEGVKAVTTGAGNPEKYMEMWKKAGISVIPVVASVALAKRMERCGADAVVAEGCESGGHVGETTTMALVPQVADASTDSGDCSRRYRQTAVGSQQHLCWEQRQYRWEPVL